MIFLILIRIFNKNSDKKNDEMGCKKISHLHWTFLWIFPSF
jgi:hypothetical protein